MTFDISVLKTSIYNEFIISLYKLFLMSNCSSKTCQEFSFYLKVEFVQLDFLPFNFLWLFLQDLKCPDWQTSSMYKQL